MFNVEKWAFIEKKNIYIYKFGRMGFWHIYYLLLLDSVTSDLDIYHTLFVSVSLGQELGWDLAGCSALESNKISI